MRLISLLAVFLPFLATLAQADTSNANSEAARPLLLGIRFNSRVDSTNTGIIQFPPGDTSGMLNELIVNKLLTDNFYLEGGLGYRSYSDVFQYSSYVVEASPGVQVCWGALLLKFSEGVDIMPQNSFDGYKTFDFVTHLSLGLKDNRTGVSFSIERTHYSDGEVEDNPSLNYTGFVFMFPF